MKRKAIDLGKIYNKELVSGLYIKNTQNSTLRNNCCESDFQFLT
jgi:hypothetical protein